MNEEIWRPVVGYEATLAVSNLGRLKRIMTGNILALHLKRDGYHYASFSNNGVPSTKAFHRMVARAFLGDKPRPFQVNHINGIKTDNRLENLEWVTPLQNVIHCREQLGKNHRGSNNGRAKLTQSQVIAIRESSRTHASLARELGVSETTILRARTGKRWAILEQ